MKKEIKDYLHSEQWAPVVGYGREYSISNKGRIKGERRASFGSLNNFRYRRACLWDGKKFVFVMIHRLVAIAFVPNPDNKPHVNHKNGIKDDNRVENLEWATVSENSQHAYDTGLRKAHPVRGENNYAAKLSETDIVIIRKSTLSHSMLADTFQVSKSVIQKIKQRKSWKHVI